MQSAEPCAQAPGHCRGLVECHKHLKAKDDLDALQPLTFSQPLLISVQTYSSV